MARENRKRAVREPVQVYLTMADRKLLREAAAAAGVSGAELLRRGMRRMAGELLADRSPAMRLLEEMNSAQWSKDTPSDAARAHDRHLSEGLTSGTGRKRRRG